MKREGRLGHRNSAFERDEARIGGLIWRFRKQDSHAKQAA
jgi:hypothetical protein